MDIGKLGGVAFRVHPTFLLVLAIYGVLGLFAQALVVFALVVGHELAHLAMAKAYGFKVVALELFPFGGAAICEDFFEGKKLEETTVAMAGPIFNVGLLFIAQGLRWEGWWDGSLSDDFVRLNFWLAAFNLLPLLPLDGGRVVRALLAGSFGFVRTTKVLAWAGRLAGILAAVVGLVIFGQGEISEGAVSLIVLGGFFWSAGGKEIVAARIVFLRQLTRKKEELIKRGLMRCRNLAVRPETPLVRIVEEFTPDSYALITLTDDRFTLAKTLTETEILDRMFVEGIHAPVGR